MWTRGEREEGIKKEVWNYEGRDTRKQEQKVKRARDEKYVRKGGKYKIKDIQKLRYGWRWWPSVYGQEGKGEVERKGKGRVLKKREIIRRTWRIPQTGQFFLSFPQIRDLPVRFVTREQVAWTETKKD